jgi:hypothetical protein
MCCDIAYDAGVLDAHVTAHIVAAISEDHKRLSDIALKEMDHDYYCSLFLDPPAKCDCYIQDIVELLK